MNIADLISLSDWMAKWGCKGLAKGQIFLRVTNEGNEVVFMLSYIQKLNVIEKKKIENNFYLNKSNRSKFVLFLTKVIRFKYR